MAAIRLGALYVTITRAPAPRRTPLGDRLRLMLHLWATRRQLGEADDRTLADLGISRAQARFEAGRAPWDLRSCYGDRR